MQKLTISVTDAVCAYVEQRAARAGYTSPGEYVCALIRADRQRDSMVTLHEFLTELASLDLPGQALPDQWWLELKDELIRRYSTEDECPHPA